MTAEEGWRRLAAALAARPEAPPLVPERPWKACPSLAGLHLAPGEALWLAVRVVADGPQEALAETAASRQAELWQAIALRRTARSGEARRVFRALGEAGAPARLFEQALAILRAGGGGFRWATEAAAYLTARGAWDPVWFVDECAAAGAGLLSRETAALLEEIQRAELQLILEAGAAGQP